MYRLCLAAFMLFLILFSCRNAKDEAALLNDNNLRRYLNNTFGLSADSLNTRLVLINFMGCKPCINKYLKFFSETEALTEMSFTFILPLSMQNETKPFNLTKNDYRLLIDSGNVIFRQNIIIEGLSIYDFKDGEIKNLKTINIFQNSRAEMYKFWFD
ncbi:MAG: hypothetical protein PHT69_10645 [Bacteroidales bacterium]|nr:hypothetical protein [Bacteroidales bacterium]